MNAQADPSVLVVGAGPVGLVLACELVRRDVPIRIIDKLTEPTDESRAIVVHARSLEMFARVGMLKELIDSGVKTTTFQMYDDGERIARIALDTVDSPFPFSVTTAQTETERVLTERLGTLGVEIERGVELVSLEQDGSAVNSTLRHADGTEENVSSSFIAGTDGAHSKVREELGTRLEGSFKGEQFLMGDVEADSALEHGSMVTYFVEHGGPMMAFPMLGKRMRLIAQLSPDSGEKSSAPTIEQLQAICDRCAPAAEIKIASSRWLTYFEIHHAQVPQYRFGRGFLAGDAAHVHSPAGAQGMNTGMQDAFNLGWKLAAAARQHESEALLDSYNAERHAVAARVIDLSTKATTLATLESPLARRLRKHALHLATGLAPIEHKLARETEETDIAYRDSPIVSGTHHHGGPRPGDAAPDVAGSDLFSELTAVVDHAIVSIAAAGTAPVIPSARPDGVRMIAVADAPAEDSAVDSTLSDPGRRIAGRYGVGAAGGWVVVRPDGYIGLIAGAGDDAALSGYFAAIGA